MRTGAGTKRSVRLEIRLPIAGQTRDDLRSSLRQALARDDIHLIFDCAASTQLDVKIVPELIRSVLAIWKIVRN